VETALPEPVTSPNCVFCRIAAGEIPADIVHENERTVTFLDASPVFPGHLLIVPRDHIATLSDLPEEELQPYFAQVQRATRAVEAGLGAQGSFVAQNNKISQTVPHLHVHVIPRTKGDGMKGFFWPRRPYRDDGHRQDIVARLKEAFESL
jgi:histidine triad (HIT) family protein